MSENASDRPDEFVPLRQDARDRHERLSREVIGLAGKREALKSRETDLTTRVGAAKGRIALKPEVEEGLQALQARAHDRSVGAFERMLTGITDDVLPDYRGQRSVKLDLTTERNMPALDFYIDHFGTREEITSGAVANVVSTGLRFIALARSGARKFLVLDEADCWIDGVAVQNYFNVVSRLSRDAGIQTVVITHHDVSSFSEEFRTYRITDVNSEGSWPARRMDLVNAGVMVPTAMQEDHLTFVQAKNFEAYHDAAIELSPGVTVISGPNQRGKSSWARMFRAALMAEAGEGLIRHGHNTAEVAIGMSDGRVLEYQRHRKGNPKAEFALHSENSWQARLSGVPLKDMRDGEFQTLHHTVGAKLPEWIPAEMGVHEIDTINVQLWPQFQPVFMLDRPPSARASLLSIGRESGHLFTMNETYKDDFRSDTVEVREGEREVAAIRLSLGALSNLDACSERLSALGEQSKIIQVDQEDLQEIAAIVDKVEQLTKQEALLLAQLSIYDRLGPVPAPVATDRLEAWLSDYSKADLDSKLRLVAPLVPMPEVGATTDIESLLQVIDAAAKSDDLLRRWPKVPELFEVTETSEIQGVIEGVERAVKDMGLKPPQLPVLPSVIETEAITTLLGAVTQAEIDAKLALKAPLVGLSEPVPTQDVEQLLAGIVSAAQTVKENADQLKTVEVQMARIKDDLDDLTKSLGNECPVCHSVVTVDMLLNEGHGHAHAHAHAPQVQPARAHKSAEPGVRPSSLPTPDEIQAASSAVREIESKPVETATVGGFRARGFRR